jgi:hypothetical protein
MSAEALRVFTAEKVNKEAGLYVEEILTSTEAPLDRIRYNQGFVAGLRRAVELQQEAYIKVNG